MKTSEGFFCHQVNGFDTPLRRCRRRRDSERRDLWRQSFLIDGQSFNHFSASFRGKHFRFGVEVSRVLLPNVRVAKTQFVSESSRFHVFFIRHIWSQASLKRRTPSRCAREIFFYNLINVLSSGKTLFLLRSIGAHTHTHVLVSRRQLSPS